MYVWEVATVTMSIEETASLGQRERVESRQGRPLFSQRTWVVVGKKEETWTKEVFIVSGPYSLIFSIMNPGQKRIYVKFSKVFLSPHFHLVEFPRVLEQPHSVLEGNSFHSKHRQVLRSTRRPVEEGEARGEISVSINQGSRKNWKVDTVVCIGLKKITLILLGNMARSSCIKRTFTGALFFSSVFSAPC